MHASSNFAAANDVAKSDAVADRPPTQAMNRQRLIIPLLILVTIAVFWRAASYPFIHYDDPDYVVSNPRVLQGLTASNIIWAFTTTHTGYYHPLTWLSLMIDTDLMGVGPRGYHTTSILLHTLAAVLLYLALRALTGAVWRSALVALLFAIHPLRVESVVWISERKDILSGCFALATLLAYGAYAQRQRWMGYSLVALFLGMGLLSKPILVTLPFLLLLLDVWPLRRWSRLALPAPSHQAPACTTRSAAYLILEKMPLLGLAIAAGILTFICQRQSGSAPNLNQLPLLPRLANVPIAYVRYLGKMFWFRNLIVLYPLHPWPLWQVAGASIVLLLITAAALLRFRSNPWLAVGWFWYLGMLAPVAGLVQSGNQSIADRYTYLPMIGVLIMLVWSLPEKLLVVQHARTALVGGCVAVAACLGGFAWRQIGYWHDSVTLFTHASEGAANNFVALYILGVAYQFERGDVGHALACYRQAVRIDPDYADAQRSLAILLTQLGSSHNDQTMLEDAWKHWSQLARLRPHDALAFNGMGAADLDLKRFDRAINEFQQALTIDPSLADAHYNLGSIFAQRRQAAQALGQFQEALRINPTDGPSSYFTGMMLVEMGRPREALPYLKEAVRLNPGVPAFTAALAQAQSRLTSPPAR